MDFGLYRAIVGNYPDCINPFRLVLNTAMRLLLFILSAMLLVATLFSCGQRKKDAAYYEQMIDSIKKAEQLKTMKQQAGVYDDPVEQYFDMLSRRMLPIRNVGSDVQQLGHLTKVPFSVASWLGFPTDTRLRALMLPKVHGHAVVMLEERRDSTNTLVTLCTLDKDYKPVDQLCLYEEKNDDRADDFGKSYSEYYITSDYEITLMYFFQSHNRQQPPQYDNSRRFVINKNGNFEETIIEL